MVQLNTIDDTANAPEWVFGDAATPDGYDTEDVRLYLFHVAPPRFLLAWDVDDDAMQEGGGEISGDVAWLDETPEPDEMAALLATAARILGACYVQDHMDPETFDD